MLRQLHHVSLLTRYRKINLAFYTEVLGLRLVKNTVNQEDTRMLHYYYGDYQGSPGSVVTFFIVPKLGQRYERAQYLSTIGLRLPKDGLTYWQERLKSFALPFTRADRTLALKDPDGVSLLLTETDQAPTHFPVKNAIPAAKQLLGLHSVTLHVRDTEKTSRFFSELLSWETRGQKIPLENGIFLRLAESTRVDTSHLGRGSIDHVAFSAANEAELARLYQRAQLQGWQIEKLASRGYFKSLYLREPGGSRIEFATIAPGFTLDQPLAELGSRFVLPPFLQPQQKQIEAELYPEEFPPAAKTY